MQVLATILRCHLGRKQDPRLSGDAERVETMCDRFPGSGDKAEILRSCNVLLVQKQICDTIWIKPVAC